ncbi:PHB depolymerase family esterase [Yinghuangia seranimata]|nr:PHB depolymerase family esterase [Yinghuangia seranimata]MDI2125522.1 PHB depolymerase family esterase [Yinghuangia seranimata]
MAAVAGAFAVVGALLVAGAPEASASGLTQVTGFGSNPGNLAMYTYAPANLPARAPLVVALHGCGQTAADYYANSGWTKYADLYGFSLVFPQTDPSNQSQSCFRWYEPGHTKRGQGEALSIKQMVDTAVARYGTDVSRVFITGLSAGGAMTADVLAAYPDVFAGGSIDSGVPAYCANNQTAAYSCMYGPVSKTPAQWGDLVRAAAPAGTTSWPRVAIWHGTSDNTVYPVNATESRDQWTNVWGVGQTASNTRTLPGGTTVSTYNDTGGRPAVALYTISGMGHGLAVDPGSGVDQCGATGAFFLDTVCSSYYTAQFWGLDGTGGGTPSLPAPTGLTVTGTTDTTASLRWDPVAGAASYAVYRNGAKVGSASGTSYTDSGLAAGTAYSYTVAAVDTSGTSGATSTPVSATTTGSATPSCFTASNYAHTTAGRAHQSGGYVYANGSNQAMGLWNVFTVHTLKQTAPGYYVLADQGCP